MCFADMYLEIFLADFTVFRVFGGNSRVRDRANYQKPCFELCIAPNTKSKLIRNVAFIAI